MTLREIARQVKYWTVLPPPALSLVRIGCALGLPAPEPRVDAPVPPTSIEELKAFAESVGVTSGG